MCILIARNSSVFSCPYVNTFGRDISILEKIKSTYCTGVLISQLEHGVRMLSTSLVRFLRYVYGPSIPVVILQLLRKNGFKCRLGERRHAICTPFLAQYRDGFKRHCAAAETEHASDIMKRYNARPILYAQHKLR